MIDSENANDRPVDPDSGDFEAADGGGASHYDPLFSDWGHSLPQYDSSAVDADDVLWLTSADWRPSTLDFYGRLPGPSRLSAAAPAVAASDPLAFPTFDQRTRLEPVTHPRPSPRSQGVQIAFVGLALIVVGVIAAASGPGAVGPFSSKFAAYAALASGAILTSAGVAGMTLGIPLPLPGVVMFREVAETVLLALLIFLAVRATFQNFKVEGASMQPSLHNNEYLIVNKLSYAGIDLSMFNFLPFVDVSDNKILHLWGSPSRGDVIVFHAPDSPGRDFIKRIIGTPGDTVEINSGTGQVSVNGKPLSEPYIQGTTNCNTSCTYAVPPEDSQESRNRCGSNACYFVMGDNRQNSSDSRGGWLVPEENIIGKTVITYYDEGKVDVKFAPNHSLQFASEAAAQE